MAAVEELSTSKDDPTPLYQGTEVIDWFVGNVHEKAAYLDPIARAFFKLGATVEARDTWERAVALARQGEAIDSNQDNMDSAAALRNIVLSVASTGDIAWAEEIARGIANPSKSRSAVADVATIASGSVPPFEMLRRRDE